MRVNQKSQTILLKIKKKYELKRKWGFVDSWKSEFVGLSDTDTGMVCTVCRVRH